MTLEELSTKLDIDVQGALDRFAGHELIYLKYLRRLCTDENVQAFSNIEIISDEQKLLNLAHTLKGTSANLGLYSLSSAYSYIVDAIRDKKPDIIPMLYQHALDLQRKTLEILRSL